MGSSFLRKSYSSWDSDINPRPDTVHFNWCELKSNLSQSDPVLSPRKEDIWVTTSTRQMSLSIPREMQTQTIARYHFITTRRTDTDAAANKVNVSVRRWSYENLVHGGNVKWCPYKVNSRNIPKDREAHTQQLYKAALGLRTPPKGYLNAGLKQSVAYSHHDTLLSDEKE